MMCVESLNSIGFRTIATRRIGMNTRRTTTEYVAGELRKMYPGGLPPRAAIERKLRDPKNPKRFRLPHQPEVQFGVTTLKAAIKLAQS
jgi:hypothetical protein